VKYRAIFLTGATGFLGVYLLNELLEMTEANIYCLIRCENAETGRKRLESHLKSNLIVQKDIDSRIIPIRGDLSKPMFGLSPERFEELSKNIDVIYHSAAQIRTLHSYERLKPVNVGGTNEVIRLAGNIKKKGIHFISSMAIFTGQKASYFSEDNMPVIDDVIKNGYRRSKWEAENIVRAAGKNRINTSIYRVSQIAGHSTTGVYSQYSTFLWLIIKACIILKKYPAIDTTINLVPVDYACKAIVCLSGKKISQNNTFHIINPQSILWKDLFIQIKAIAYPLEELSYKSWLDLIIRQPSDHPENKLFTMLRIFLSSNPPLLFAKKPKFDDKRTCKGLQDTSIVCPQIDKKLLSLYLTYFEQIGFIPTWVHSQKMTE
jgi:thioester reductase-like protein